MKLTADYLRDQEFRLTTAQKELAFEMVENWGWPRGSVPPLWVWHHAFNRAELDPTNWKPDFSLVAHRDT